MKDLVGSGRWAAALAASALALSAVMAGPARAQSVNVQAFQPSPYGGDLLSVLTAGTGTPGQLTAGTIFHFTKDPLGFQGVDGFGRVVNEDTVDSRLMSELLVSYALSRWLDVGLALPFVLVGSGKAPDAGLSTVGDTGGFALGEARLSLRSGLLTGRPVRLAFQLDATLPTGDEAKLAANGLGFAPRLVADWRSGGLTVALNVGAYFRDEATIGLATGDAAAPSFVAADADGVELLTVGNELTAGLGGSYQISRALALIGEAYARTPLTAPFGDENATQLEAMGGVRWKAAETLAVTAGGGGGTPLFQGYGTSRFRFFAGLSWAPTFEDAPDGDGDGVPDDEDSCPLLPEDFDGFEDDDGCPDPDNDGDGVLDIDDKCPNDPEDVDGFEDEDGCPDLDNDEDRIPDAQDKCPNEPEDFDGFEDDDGCPDPDNDGDGLADVDDKCPNEPETVNGFEDQDGCPDFPGVSVQGDRIVLETPIRFASGKAELPPATYDGLRNLARLLDANPSWRVRIDVYTDDRGKADKLTALAETRAQAVLQFLVTEGVNFRRLEANGVGPASPVADNKTAAGREANNRVELTIIKR